MGAGPRVLVQGKPIFHPAAEGFADPKILFVPARAPPAGTAADDKLYLITVTAARVSDLGPHPQSAGFREA